MDSKNFKFQKHGIIALVLSFLLLNRLFSNEFYLIIPEPYYLTVHIILEFFSTFVAYAIAVQSFFTYQYTKSERKFSLGIVFVVVGVLNIFHALMYQGMPIGLAASRATYFWLISQLTAGVGLILYILDWLPKIKITMLISSIYLFFILLIVIFWGPFLPPMLTPSGGVTKLKILIEYAICFLNLTAIILMRNNKSLKERKINTRYLAYGVAIILLGELVFTLYKSIYDTTNLLGHAYKGIGYALIFRSLYIVSLQKPFEDVEKSLKRFNQIFQFAPIGLAILGKSDCRYLEINNHFKHSFSHVDKDFIGNTPLDVGFPTVKYYKILEQLDKMGRIDNFEITFSNDRTYLLSAESTTFGNEECFIFSSSDITDLKRLQTEMCRLDRLNLVGQMAAGIAHEIRNPMTTVRGYLQLMSEKSDEEKKATFDFMIEELDRANSIIKEFLSLARINETTYELADLNTILKNLYPLIEADAFTQNKQISFLPGAIPNINVNPNEITQMILNLCRNGLEAMNSNGCLTIQTYYKYNNVVLAIEDEGQGIPKELLDKLGTPFFTTKENGTGLGLAICYKIAQAHKATITVDSNSQGTKFLVSFPVDNCDSTSDIHNIA